MLTIEELKKTPAAVLKSIPALQHLTVEAIEETPAAVLQTLLNAYTPATGPTETPLSDLRTTVDVFRRYCEDQSIAIGFTSLRKNGRNIDLDRVTDNYITWCQSNTVKKEFYNKAVDGAFRTLRSEAYENTLDNVWATMSGANDSSIFDNFKQRYCIGDVEGVVLQWWMSDTKRRLRSLASGQDVDTSEQVPYPIFYGNQGSGKTFIVKELKKPLQELSVARKAKDIMDDFAQQQYGKMVIVDFDDISSIDHKDMAAFKTWVTASVLQPRKMRSEEHHFIKKVSTGIGSSNHPVSTVFADTTGSRRLFQINAPKDGYTHLLKEDEHTDFFTKLWASIDVEWRPTAEQIKLISDTQVEEQRNKHPIELWFRDTYSNSPFGSDRKSSELFAHFNEYSETQGFRKVNIKSFGNAVTKHLALELERKKKSSGNVYNRITPEPEASPEPEPEVSQPHDFTV